MKINSISLNKNKKEVFMHKLSAKTIENVEKQTKLTYNEMTKYSIDECHKLMLERGAIKEPSKFKIWLSNVYKKFGEKFGLLEKEYKFYTDID